MARGLYLRNNLTKDTLIKIAALGVIIIAASTSPYFLHAVAKHYFREKIRELVRKRAKKLRELQKRKLLEFKEMPDGSLKIVLSHLGKKLVRQYKLEEMKLIKPKKWDRKWRLIIYDIPDYQRKASDAFRRKLKDLGLYQLQKSVWVSPYECIGELEFLCSVFDINMDNHVHYFKTLEIPKEKEIKKFFGL